LLLSAGNGAERKKCCAGCNDKMTHFHAGVSFPGIAARDDSCAVAFWPCARRLVPGVLQT
jgi:hypothetical protein